MVANGEGRWILTGMKGIQGMISVFKSASCGSKTISADIGMMKYSWQSSSP